MGKILLISSKRILNQAVSLYLFPQHDVQVKSSLEEIDPKALQECDLLIVDAPGGTDGKSDTEVTRSIQKLKTPTLWLEGDGSIPPPKRKRILSLKMPIEREAFQKAMDDLLSTNKPSKEKSGSQGGGGREGKSPEGESQFIDLVDIVEEETGPNGS
jgi:hypothetical protein